MVETRATSTNPVESMEAERDWESRLAAWRANTHRVSYLDALNAAELARQYPSAGPDVVAGITMGGWRWDQSTISEIIAADQRHQSWTQRQMTRFLGPVTRPLFAGFEDLYRQGVSRPFNQAVRMAQGESFGEARENAGMGLMGQWMLANARGENPTLGQGLLPGMNPDPLMAPGASDQLTSFMEQGLSPAEAMSATEAWVLDNVGFDVMNATRRDAETTMLHKTKNGQTISYHATPGRVLLAPVTEWIAPETAPHRFMSGALDVTAQIVLDPNNPLFDELTKLAKFRRTAMPTAAARANSEKEIAMELGGIEFRERPKLMGDGVVYDINGNEVTDPYGIAAGDWSGDAPWETVPGYAAHAGGPIDGPIGMGGFATDTRVAEQYFTDASVGGAWARSGLIDDLLESEFEDVDEVAEAIESFIHLFPIDEMPEAMQRILRHPKMKGVVSQFLSWDDLVRLYPDVDPKDLRKFHEQYNEASRTAESARSLVYSTDPPTFHAMEMLLDAENITDVAEFNRRWHKYFEMDAEGIIRRKTAAGDLEDIPQTVDELIESQAVEWAWDDTLGSMGDDLKTWRDAARTRDLNPVFGNAAEHPLWSGSAYDTLKAMYHHLGIGDDSALMFGDEPFRPTPSVSYTQDEWQELMELGVVFPTRDQYELYKASIKQMQDAGAHRIRGKWMFRPKDIDWFFDSGRGNRYVKWVSSKSRSLDELDRAFPGAPKEDIGKLHDIINGNLPKAELDELPDAETFARQIIQDNYGSMKSGRAIPKAPARSHLQAARQKITPSAMAASGESIMSRAGMRLSHYGKRLVAEMGHTSIDPTDPDGVLKLVRSWAKTLRRSSDDLDQAIRSVYKMDGTRKSGKKVAEHVWNWLGDELVRMGYSEDEIEKIFSAWNDAVAKNEIYADDALGNTLPLQHAKSSTLRTRFGNVTWEMPQAVLDSQLASRHLFVPNLRDVRRATGRLRTINDHLTPFIKNRELPGLGASKGQHLVDMALASWRNLALLRPGWIMRVLPDELARFYAYGYSDIVTSPLAIMMMSMGKWGDNVTDDLMLSVIHSAEGLGADTGLARNLADDTPLGHKITHGTSVRGANWNSLEAAMQDEAGNIVLTQAGRKGVARVVMQLYSSELQQLLAKFNGDVVATLRHLKEDKSLLLKLSKMTEPDTFLGKAVHFRQPGSEEALEHVLHTINAQRHQYAGGKWIARKTDGSGWIDSYGRNVEDFEGLNPATKKPWTKTDLQEILPPGPQGGAARGNLAELKRQARMQNDLPADLPNLPKRESVVITKEGDPELLALMEHGRMRGEPDIIAAKHRASDDLFRGRLGDDRSSTEFVYVIQSDNARGALHASKGGYEAYSDLHSAANKLKPGEAIYIIPKEDLNPSVFVGTGAKRKVGVPPLSKADQLRADKLKKIDFDNLAAHTERRIAEGSDQLIMGNMGKKEIQALEERLARSYTQSSPPVARVRVPDKPYADVDDERSIIDRLFEMIGRNPSMSAARKPFATLRTWELIAEEYIFSTPAVRAKIMQQAYDTGIGARFERFVQQHLDTYGMKAPVTRKGAHTMEQIVDMAWRQAVEDTKNLFYDLSKGGNWQDAARLVFPFADAWWEVLSRWAGLMNPIKQGGKPIKLLRRVSQGYVGAERSGYFETSSDGRRVFSIPGAAHMTKFWSLVKGGEDGQDLLGESGLQITPQVSVEQFMFIDFGDPTSAFRPGMSPFVQVPAAYVRPHLPPDLLRGFDRAIFNGFAAPHTDVTGSVKAFMPTWMRRIIEAVVDGEHDERYAGIMVEYVNGLLQTPQYENAVTDRDLALKAVEEAQTIAGWLATVDIVASSATPAQPRNVIEMMREDEQGNVTTMSMVALASDWARLRSIYGQDEAIQYMRQMYGIDPLKLSPKTWASLQRPNTDVAFEELQRHEGASEALPLTLMAWLPPDTGQFSTDAWLAQRLEGAREKLSAKDATYYVGHVAGSYRMAKLREERDQYLADAEQHYGGTDNSRYRAFRDNVVTPWYQENYYDIYTQYWAYGPNSGVTGLTNRPSYKEMVGELRDIATPGTQAYEMARDMNPELQGFVQYAMQDWEYYERLSMDLGFNPTWWFTSTSEKNAAPRIRQEFQSRLQSYLERMSGEGAVQAEWIVRTIFQPLLQGFDFDNPVVIAPTVIAEDDVKYIEQFTER